VTKSILSALRTISVVAALAAGSAQAADWEWSLTPYLWGTETTFGLEGDSGEGIERDLDFPGLVDKLDFALLLHFEGRKGGAGFFADLIYLDTGDKLTIDRHPTLPGGTELRTDVKTTLFEGGGFFRPLGAETPFDLMLGLRTIKLDMEIDIELPNSAMNTVRADESLADIFLGARYTLSMSEKWNLALRGDVGTGDTRLTWNLSGLIGYQFGKRGQYEVLAGYRHMDIEFKKIGEAASNARANLVMSGPLMGFQFRF